MKFASELQSAHSWDVFSPPPMNSLQGTIVPRALIKRRRRRKVAVEVHLVEPNAEALSDKPEEKKDDEAAAAREPYEQCIFRVLEPIVKDPNEEDDATAAIQDDQTAMTQSTTSTTKDGGGNYLDPGSMGYEPAAYDREWKTVYRLPMRSLSIKGGHRTGVIVCFETRKLKQVRELIFDSNEEADDFRQIIEANIAKEEERALSKFRAVVGDKADVQEGDITFLIEICSAKNLPVGDMTSSDPFVKVYLDDKKVHETGYIAKNLDPIWTVKTGSLFLMKVNAKEMFRGEGLHCVVKDWDKLSGNETLAEVTISPKTLYEANGERLEFPLKAPPGSSAVVNGTLAIRCRRASEYDIQFMKEFCKAKQDDGEAPKKPSTMFGEGLNIKKLTDASMASAGGSGNIKSMINKRTRIHKTKEHPDGIKQWRVRPCPDPQRVEETTWMSKEEVEKETMKDSHRWIESGSGNLGRIFVEVLGCDNLPNLDTGGFAGNLTDAYCCLVFEDTVMVTDIIDDNLSPRWLPWSKRAFICHMQHSSSQLFLAVFDFDAGVNPADDHDPVGRVAIDLTNFRKNTTYLLKFALYETANVKDRVPNGTVTVRLRLEIEDERRLLLSTLEPPPQVYVNCKTRKEFRVVRYTCTGHYNIDSYSMKTINAYIEELLALQSVQFYLQDAIIALLLWRGTSRFSLLGESFHLPIQSLTAFVVMTQLVERPEYIPSFFFFSIAWLSLAIMEYRRRAPDLWLRCKSFMELSEVLATGASGNPPDSIKPYENHEEAEAFIQAWKDRLIESEQRAAKEYEEAQRTQQEFQQHEDEAAENQAEADMSTTNAGGLSIDPFKSVLYPIQQNLALLCRYVRHVKHILDWQECYIAYWLASGCMLLSVIFLFVPWFFIIKWTSRIMVWTLFGPWMKLVDTFYVSKIEPETDEALSLRHQKERERLREVNSAAIKQARVRKEDAVKMKAMKQLMFGEYITRVPILKEDRYRDQPLPESTATPWKQDPVPLSELAMQEAGYGRLQLPGQNLTGDMIPKIKSQSFTKAPVGQATAHPGMVDRKGPGGASVKKSVDSSVGAYAWIGTLVLSAGFITWLGVPFLAAGTEQFLSFLSNKTAS